MDFKHPEGVTVQVMLPRRSLLVMTGESRYLWTHGITPRKFDTIQASEQFKGGIINSDIGDLTLSKRGMRTSFTFRKVRRIPCNCSYSSVCDRQRKATPPSLLESSKEALELEQKHVHHVYDEIASHFSSTRHSPWPRIVEFLKALPSGSIVADIGCGNGKYLGINKELYMIGCDRSRNLVDICRERQFQALVCDALAVPVRSGSCDACISIAVIHHFATAVSVAFPSVKERRVEALQEIARLLRSGGQALIYVWAMEQEYRDQKSKYLKGNRISQGDKGELNSATSMEQLLVNQMPEGVSEDPGLSVHSSNNTKDEECKSRKVLNSELPIHTNRTCFHSQDVLVPWHLKGKPGKDKAVEQSGLARCPDPRPVFHRYYHVFCNGELEASCQAVGDVSILQSFYDQGNWCVVLQKV
ncbi:alkylated DNA repair protein alkB homolog 8 isoform X5 [Rattus norvegicus]